MPWYTTEHAIRDAQKPGATINPSKSLVMRLAKESGAWEPQGLPSDWSNGDLVFTPAQLYGFARLLAAEMRDPPKAGLEAEIARLQAQVDALAKELEQVIEWHKYESIPLRQQELASIKRSLAAVGR